MRTLIAAYKALGGSFTGTLAVDPTHRSAYKRDAAVAPDLSASIDVARPGSDRSRRIRDAVEAALSDILLLGTEEQVKLAATAAAELAAGRHVETAAPVVWLRDFIRQVLDLDPIPSTLVIPKQGPARALASKGGKDGDKDGGKPGGGGMGGGGGSLGTGIGTGHAGEDPHHD